VTEMCRSCHAEIDWATRDPGAANKDGWTGDRPKSNPVDHDSADDPKGNLAVWRDEGGVTLECGCYLRAAELRSAPHVVPPTAGAGVLCPTCHLASAVRQVHPNTGALHYRYLKKGDELRPGEHRGRSHFSSCPNARQHRNRDNA
jgi:hypothetical protein